MVFWVGTAAVGYVAKFWHKLFSKKSSSESIPADSIHGESEISSDVGLDVVASSSGKHGEECEAPLTEHVREKIDGLSDERVCDLNLTGKCSYFQRFQGGRNLTSSCSNGYAVKPFNPLESYSLTYQFLHSNRARFEEYVYTPFASPCTLTMKPLMVNEGSRRTSFGFNDKTWLENGDELQNHGGLEKSRARLRSVENARIRKPNARKGRHRRRSGFATRAFTEPFHSQGSSKGMVLFFHGITVGMVSSIFATKREMDKLNEQLKQTQNLVQDLNEELEMKALLIVKELANDDLKCQETNEQPFLNGISPAFSPEKRLDEVTQCGSKDHDDLKAYYSGARSKIEAELEAELELLELNIQKSSSQRMSHYDMVDSCFREDEFEGYTRLDKLNRGLRSFPDSDHDKSRAPISHICETNNAVSPWQLSCRLHEVIKLRLEARIMELETELENYQKRAQSMEVEKTFAKRDSYSELSSQSTVDILAGTQEGDESDCQLVINFSGQAPDSYNQAYEEITKMTRMDKEATTQKKCATDCIQRVKHPLEKKQFKGQNRGENLSTPDYGVAEERWSRFLTRDKIMPLEECFSRSFSSLKISENSDIDEDEIEKDSIKKIVEKSNCRCHPSLLNAQRLLFCSINDEKLSLI